MKLNYITIHTAVFFFPMMVIRIVGSFLVSFTDFVMCPCLHCARESYYHCMRGPDTDCHPIEGE